MISHDVHSHGSQITVSPLIMIIHSHHDHSHLFNLLFNLIYVSQIQLPGSRLRQLTFNDTEDGVVSTLTPTLVSKRISTYILRGQHIPIASSPTVLASLHVRGPQIQLSPHWTWKTTPSLGDIRTIDLQLHSRHSNRGPPRTAVAQLHIACATSVLNASVTNRIE